MRLRHLVLTLSTLVISASSAQADLLVIDSVRYTTSLQLTTGSDFYTHPITGAEILIGDSLARTKHSVTTPLHDEAVLDASEVRAEAAPYFVSAWGNGVRTDTNLFGYGSASAQADLTFSPRFDATAPFGLDFRGLSEYWWSEALVRLYDLTAGEELWTFAWEEETMKGNVPWFTPGGGYEHGGVVSLSVPTRLLASHDYFLTMYTRITSDGDSEGMSIRVRVPEPSTILLLGAGVMGVLLRRRSGPSRTA